MVKVDVVVFAHNHASFVAEALRGVLFQRTSATVRVRIHDDASTDGTADVIRQVMEDSPFEWELEIAKKNKYQFGSAFKYYFAADTDADFVAFLDADDYWTDPGKLEAQVDLFERYPDVALCHTGYSVLDQAGKAFESRPPEKYRAELVPGHYLSEGNFIGTLTVMIRKSHMPNKLPPGFDRLRVDDYPIWALVSDGSSIGYLEKVTATYRLHGSNNFAGQSKDIQRKQALDAMVWVANAVQPNHVAYWLDGIENFSKRPSLRLQVLGALRKLAGRALKHFRRPKPRG